MSLGKERGEVERPRRKDRGGKAGGKRPRGLCSWWNCSGIKESNLMLNKKLRNVLEVGGTR